MVRLLFILVMYSAFQLQAQGIRHLDDLVFPCVKASAQTDISLQQGAKAILFTRPGLIGEQLKPVLSFFGKYHQSLILIFDETFNEDSMKAVLQEKFKKDLCLINSPEWPSVKLLRENKVFALFRDDVTYTSDFRVTSASTYATRFSSDPLNKMVVFTPNSSDTLQSQCLQCWRLTGKVPNFLLLNDSDLRKAESTIEFINNTRRFIGEVRYKGKILNDIRWKQHPALITPGRFTYPVTGYSEILSPYKNGFRITPGEIIHHINMVDTPRIFTAFESSIDDHLMMYFPFDGKICNMAEPDWTKIIVNNVEILRDKERGKVACFTKNDAYIDYAKENELNFDTPISIAVWIKPESLKQFMGIVGLGSSFSLKLKDGVPDFTTANIKDHMESKSLEPGKWHHVAVVFNPNSTVEIYMNGERSSILKASDIKPSRQSFLIGTNLWGEQFFGSIDDLKIWDRGLSEKEIKAVFLEQNKTGVYPYVVYATLFACAIVLFIIVTFRVGRGKRKKTPVIPKTEIPGSSISLFGTFQVNTVENGNLTSKFSPLLKQLLAFFILNDMENKNGVSIQKLTDTFWPGAPPDKAKENRGTNLKKLRRLLDEVEGIAIKYEGKKWYFSAGINTAVDVFHYVGLAAKIREQLVSGKVDHSLINNLLEIIKDGNILQNSDAEWLDSYKSAVSDEIIDLLFTLLKSEANPELKIGIAKAVLKFDQLNGNALKQILVGFTSQGKHGQARQFYDDFCRKYLILYNEAYPVPFKEIIKM